jgi:hypothetical protein
MNIEPPRKVALERVAAAYGVSTEALRSWKRRGITTGDLLNPFTLAPKLRASAVNDSPRLRLLEDKTTCGQITFRLAVAGLIEP